MDIQSHEERIDRESLSRQFASQDADRRAVELGYGEYPDMGAMLRYFEWCFPGQTGGES